MAVSESAKEFDLPKLEEEPEVEINPLLRARLLKASTYSSSRFNGVAQVYQGLNQVSGLADGDQVDLILANGSVIPGVFVAKASETEPIIYTNVPDMPLEAVEQILAGVTNQKKTDHNYR